jgi:predicted Ser/Thr protein kinase
MGEVYSASDTRLQRTVAVKVCTDQFSERFEREARAVAALNHSHICQIYDVGPNYLVMEYIAGQPLKGPLPIDQALKYAGQICDALDAAHRKGIVHRDLKPANILVTKSGVKLLDFGLAKIEPAVATPGEHTMTMALTGKGQILGTLHYMSPEQLQGRDADARSDIFAFGLVLYEMLTGQRAFQGESPASVVGAILERPAPSVAGVAPAALDRVLQRCLAKEPDERWQSARDVRAALEVAEEGEAVAEAPGRGRWSARAGWLAAAALLVLVLLFAPWRGHPPSSADLVRFTIYPPEGTVFTGATNATVPVPQFAVSPDGRAIVFATAAAGARPFLSLRRLAEVTAHPIPGTEGAAQPFWSPDSKWVGFSADGQLKRVPESGGPVQAMVSGGLNLPRGGAWGTRDVVLFSDYASEIQRVSPAGGPTAPATKRETDHGEGQHVWPHFLPDGHHFLYTVRGSIDGHHGVYAGAVDGTLAKPLIGVDSGAVYSPPGYVLWVDGDTLLGQSFDADRMELREHPFSVAEGVGHSSAAQAAVSVSSSGATLAYSGSIVLRGRLMWFDRSGKQLDGLSPEGDYSDFQLSPDGRLLAASLVDAKTGIPDIWLTLSRYLASPSSELQASFSPDCHLVAYASDESGSYQVYVQTLPLSDRKWPVSTTGGYEPRWRGDGHEIYYLSQDKKLMAVAVGAGPSFGPPRALFQTRVSGGVNYLRTHYDVTRDGQRFLVNTPIGDPPPNPITIMLNWTAGLKR